MIAPGFVDLHSHAQNNLSQSLQVRTSGWSAGTGTSEATFGNPSPKLSTHSFGCHFVEVTWQPAIARLRVSRVVTVIDAGRILNPLAGRNQIEAAVVMGIGTALLEHTAYAPRTGAPINSSLADYAVHHATGVRVRELPVKSEDLLSGAA